MNYQKLNQNKKSKGFTLLVSMIVTSLILAIGFSIGNIILKELALSASGRRSQIAFYAADSISECALYWDRKDAQGNAVEDSPFATSTPVGQFIQCGTGVGITTSASGNIANFKKETDNLIATSSFAASFSDLLDPSAVSCGEVVIVKNVNKTLVEARGYNVGYSSNINSGEGGCDISNPKTVERGIKVDY